MHDELNGFMMPAFRFWKWLVWVLGFYGALHFMTGKGRLVSLGLANGVECQFSSGCGLCGPGLN
jgi:hypothetical protein